MNAVEELRAIRRQVRDDAKYLARSMRGMNEDFFFLPFIASSRIRMTALTIYSGAALIVALQISSNQAVIVFETGSSGLITIPFPRVIEPGTYVALRDFNAGTEVFPGGAGVGVAVKQMYITGRIVEDRIPDKIPNLIQS